MINYNLAKQLEKGGFKFSVPVTKANEKYLEYPQLSELIKACGDEFLGLFRNDDGEWIADSRVHECNCGKATCDGINWEVGEGKTPKEAVAKLWLKINNKRQ